MALTIPAHAQTGSVSQVGQDTAVARTDVRKFGLLAVIDADAQATRAVFANADIAPALRDAADELRRPLLVQLGAAATRRSVDETKSSVEIGDLMTRSVSSSSVALADGDIPLGFVTTAR